MSFDDYYWLGWLVLLVVYELYAAFNKKPGDTLSENVWDWFAIRRPGAKYGTLRRALLAGFLMALTGHFVYDAPVTFIVVFSFGLAWSVYYFYKHEAKGAG